MGNGLQLVWRSGCCGLGKALGEWSGGNVVSCTTSRVASVSGSHVGDVVIIESEAGDGGDDDGFGNSFNFLKNFLFLNVTLPVPSTFTEYWS